MKTLPIRLIGIAIFLSVFLNTAGAQDFDPRRYLQSGDLNYTIEVNFTEIDRVGPSEIQQEIEARRKAVNENPSDPGIFVDYISFLADTPFERQAQAAADKAMDTFLALHAREQSTRTARWLLTVANASASRDRLNQGYNAVLDLLASRDATPEIAVKIMRNRELAGERETALAVGEDYLSQYPDSAELNFRTFLLTTRKSVYEVVPRLVRSTAQSVLPGNNPDAADMKRFFRVYFASLWDSIRIDLLERAVELEPENYQYNMTNTGFRAIVRWLSLVQSIAVIDPRGEIEIQDLFHSADSTSILKAKSSLETALLRRPNPDIQIFLAGAMHYATSGIYEQAVHYAQLARETRPRRSEGYDALIFLELIGSMSTDTFSEEVKNSMTSVLLDKIETVGENPYDYFVLAGIETRNYIDTMESASDQELMLIRRRIRTYARKSLELQRSPFGLVSLGNAELLGDSIDEAVELYDEAVRTGSAEVKGLALTNTAIASLIEGNDREAADLLRRALTEDPRNATAAELLQRIGN